MAALIAALALNMRIAIAPLLNQPTNSIGPRDFMRFSLRVHSMRNSHTLTGRLFHCARCRFAVKKPTTRQQWPGGKISLVSSPMRRLLFILPFVVPGAAFAQSQAANPVTPFSEGQRVGTSLNPIFAALSSVVPSASASSGQAAAPVELFSYGRRVGTQGNPIYVNLGNALASYLTQSQAASTYLPLTGGNTSGALNGVMTFQGLVGSSASGASTVLTTDGSGAIATGNCYQVPAQGVTHALITVVGVSSNGTDAVMQTYPGVALFTANGTPSIQGTSATYYPTFGSPGTWSVAAAVDAPTKCVMLTAKASGTGSWKWRASIRAEDLIP